jgi:hypothetical protein
MKNIYTILSAIFLLAVSCSGPAGQQQGTQTLLVNLNELPKEKTEQLKAYFKADNLSREKGSLSIRKEDMPGHIRAFLQQSLLNNDIKEFDFYQKEAYPRLGYWEYIIVQLPEFVQYGYKYSGYSEDLGEKESLFAFLCYRSSRDAKYLRKLFNDYKAVIYSIVTPEIYKERHFDLYVSALIETHKHLKDLPNYEMEMSIISEGVAAADKDPDIFGRTAEQALLYDPVLKPGIDACAGIEMYPTDELWFYSFWLRRYREGNSKVIFEILQEIDQHYQS